MDYIKLIKKYFITSLVIIMTFFLMAYFVTEYFYNANNPTKDKTKVLYDGMYHEILNEVEKEKVMNDILTWLKERKIA